MQRRLFLRRSILLAFGNSVAAMLSGSFPVRVMAGLQLSELDERQARVLAVMARCLFPHPQLDDAYYIAVANHIDRVIAVNNKAYKLVLSGLETLHSSSDGDWLVLPVEQKISRLETLAHPAFMGFMINTTIDALYRNQEVIGKFGYQGSSIEHGGYINRGFDDIDWLPRKGRTR